MKNILSFTQQAISEAEAAVLEIYGQDFMSVEKSDQSPVTEADLQANKILIEKLKTYGWPILSEESVDDLSRLEAERAWVIDPLDGTKDFIQKTGEFSIMVGLVEQQRPILGIVSVPAQKKMYWAIKDQGAFVQTGSGSPQKITVSQTQNIQGARQVSSRNHLAPDVLEFSKKHKSKLHKCGSNGIKVGVVAEGQADLFFNSTHKMGQWDSCAPDIIIHEAGGTMTDTRGQKIMYNQSEVRLPYGIVASNGQFHNALLSFFSK